MLSFSEKQLQKLDKESGENTWHVISKNGDVEIIRKKYFDLDEAKINLKNKEDLTPIAIAIRNNNHEMVKELIKCGAKNSKEEMLIFIGSAIEKNNLEMVKELIECAEEIPKEEMLNFIKNSIKNKNAQMNIYLIYIFNKNFNSGEDFQAVNPSYSSEEEKQSIYDVPSCEPSSAEKMEFSLSNFSSKSLS